MSITITNIERALQAEDVEGLLTLGAPHDEYSHEAQEIAAALNSPTTGSNSDTKVLAVIQQVWNQCFGPFSEQDIQKRVPAFQRITKQLLSVSAE